MLEFQSLTSNKIKSHLIWLCTHTYTHIGCIHTQYKTGLQTEWTVHSHTGTAVPADSAQATWRLSGIVSWVRAEVWSITHSLCVHSRHSDPKPWPLLHSTTCHACLVQRGQLGFLPAWSVIEFCPSAPLLVAGEEQVLGPVAIPWAGYPSLWFLSCQVLFWGKPPGDNSESIAHKPVGVLHRHVVTYLSPEPGTGLDRFQAFPCDSGKNPKSLFD